MATTLQDITDRSAVNQQTGCWEWQLSTNKDGYGYVWYQGKNHYAHRVAFMLTYNVELTRDDYICHSCDNPACVKPEHLFFGDQQVNMDDMTEKNRAARGEQNGRAKLTRDQVLEIRTLVGTEAPSRLASRYGVSPSTISDIWDRRIWAWL